MDKSNIQYIQERLYHWAEWFSRGNFYGLGYPSNASGFGLMNAGDASRKRYYIKPLPVNAEAEEMELLVKEMDKQNHDMAKALRCYYLTRGPLRMKAEKISLSHTQFKIYVDMAHQWVAGWLTSKEMLKIKRS